MFKKFFKPDFVVLTVERFNVLSSILAVYNVSYSVEDFESTLVRIPYYQAVQLCKFLESKGISACIERPSFFDCILYDDYYRLSFLTLDELCSVISDMHNSYVSKYGKLCDISLPDD